MRYLGGSLNRTLCAVLEAMRKCNETRNYSPILGLIEEAQIHGDAMEAALYDQSDIKRHKEYIKELKAEIKDLETKKKTLGGTDVQD